MSNKSEFYKNSLKPLSNKKIKKYDFIGFDIETKGENNDFLLGGIYYETKSGKEVYKSFTNQEDMCKYFFKNQFKGKYIVATNLGFDFTKLFWGTEYWNKFERIERSGQLLSATYKPKDYNKKGSIKFIDTTNYVFFSVEKLGNILGYKKLPKPSSWLRIKNKDTGEDNYIPQTPKNTFEWQELKTYNKRDCKISYAFMKFFQNVLNQVGGELKITIASSSFDVWRRRFLKTTLVKEKFRTGNQTIEEFIFNAYYGGRTETFERGYFSKLWVYDINSLYPSVMKKHEYPLPNSVRIIKKQDFSINYINNFEGVSKVRIKTPDNLDKPFLAFKHKGKLIFPKGTFTGYYNHVELRKALELGYKILEIKGDYQVIYTKTFRPFKEFVDVFYKIRNQYKKEGNIMQLPIKLILNSLYGKFAQRYINKSKIIDMTKIKDQDLFTKLYEKADVKGDIAILNEEEEFNGKNKYPILSSYCSSYARILMYDYIDNKNVVYTDTDSVMTKEDLKINSEEIGEMKLEGVFYDNQIYKPKMYFLQNKKETKFKCKGVQRANKEDFKKILIGEKVKKQKLIKLKESIRQNKIPYQQNVLVKKVDLNDDKRIWIGNTSTPITLIEGDVLDKKSSDINTQDLIKQINKVELYE